MQTVLLAALLQLALSGCNILEPCRQLAERICSCELSESARQRCREDRIQSQQDPIPQAPDPDEQEKCAVSLETCTCDALDTHRTDLCGFTNAPGDPDNDGLGNPDDPETDGGSDGDDE